MIEAAVVELFRATAVACAVVVGSWGFVSESWDGRGMVVVVYCGACRRAMNVAQSFFSVSS